VRHSTQWHAKWDAKACTRACARRWVCGPVHVHKSCPSYSPPHNLKAKPAPPPKPAPGPKKKAGAGSGAGGSAVAPGKPATTCGKATAAAPPPGGGSPGAGPSPAPATPTSASGELADGAAAAAAVAGLRLGPAAPPPALPRSAYRHEPRLAAALAASAAATAAVTPPPPTHRHAGELHLVILGHVDAGKSTLTGRLLADVGAVPGRSAANLARAAAAAGKASFGWAWLLDASADERERGVTVDVAAARFGPTPHWACVALADAPGHRDFVPAAMAGAAAADAAVLVVDGTPGGFEAGFGGGNGGGDSGGYGQTKEHATLARALGITQLVVAVTKLDGAGWPPARFCAVRSSLAPFLDSLGFARDAVQWLPVSAPAGQNVSSPPTDASLAAWWRAGGGVEAGGFAGDPFPTLLSAIDALSPVLRDASGPLRLPIGDVAKGPRATVVVAGRVAGGAVCPGMKVTVEPGGAVALVERVATVGASGGGEGTALSLSPSPLAVAGEGTELTLAGLPGPEAVAAGCVLCPVSCPAPALSSFTARVVVLDTPGVPPLLRGACITLHAHALQEAAVVTGLIALVNAEGTVTRPKPRLVPRGGAALITVTPVKPVALEAAADCKPLGRVVLRDGGRTVAVGVVV